MNQIADLLTEQIMKEIHRLSSLMNEHGGNVDSHDDALVNCKKRIDRLRQLRLDVELLEQET